MAVIDIDHRKRILGSALKPAILFLGSADSSAIPPAVAAVFFKKFRRLKKFFMMVGLGVG
jgi:hypothetical protein